MTDVAAPLRKRESHVWERNEHDHYVEEMWCSARLFAVEHFHGTILDPACGWGRVLRSADAAGHGFLGSDIVNRAGAAHGSPVAESTENFRRLDFLGLYSDEVYRWWQQADAIVTNPPFDLFEDFARRALALTREKQGKVAMIWLVRRLNAARWLQETPLARVYLMTPRPSMPPGYVIESGQKPGGGTQDFCWLVWDHAHQGVPELRWLHRDKEQSHEVGTVSTQTRPG